MEQKLAVAFAAKSDPLSVDRADTLGTAKPRLSMDLHFQPCDVVHKVVEVLHRPRPNTKRSIMHLRVGTR